MSTKRLTVLLVHNRYQEPGGEDVAVDADAALLESRGHHVFRFERDNAELIDLGVARRAQAGAQTIWSARTAREISRSLEEIRPDVMHAHNTFPLISPSAYAVAARHGVPVVQTIHNYRIVCAAGSCTRQGSSCRRCIDVGWPWPAVRYACYRNSRAQSALIGALQVSQRLKRRISDPVSLYLPVSQFVSTFLEDAGALSKDRVMVRHNYIDPDPGERDEREDEGYVAFVGRITPEKGTEVLVRAAARAPEVPVVIAGDGPSRSAVESLAHDLGCGNVRFCGRLPRPAALGLIRKARCLVFPSVWDEPCPMVLLEASALGVPAIASATGGVPEIVGQTGTMVPRADATALAAALSDAILDPTGWRARGHAARRSWEANFTGENGYRTLMAAYSRAGVAAARAEGFSP